MCTDNSNFVLALAQCFCFICPPIIVTRFLVTHFNAYFCSSTLDESHDLQATIERLRKRCEAVQVKVNTIRSPEQEQALSKVESLVQDLERICILGQVDNDESSFSKRALCLLNACTSDAPFEGPIDYKFQGMVLGCKLEDQKMVRHRLECLVNGRCHEDFVEAHIGQTMAGAASVSQLEQEMQQCSTSSCNVTPSH